MVSEEKIEKVGDKDLYSQYLSQEVDGPMRPFYKTTPPELLFKQLSKFTKLDKLAFILLISFTMFVRLYNLSYPDSVVFDEVHFLGFASKYIKNEYFVDVHPPLVKLIYSVIGRFSGYNGYFDYSKIGNTYLGLNGEPLVPYLAMRLFSASCGLGTVFLVYKIARLSGCNTLVSLCGSLLCCCENSLITQSRYILLDSPLIFFISLSVFSYKLLSVSVPFSSGWTKYLCLLGVSVGLSIGTKWVGFFTMAYIGLLTLRDFWFLFGDLNVTNYQLFKHFSYRVYFLIVIPVTFYLSLFALHFMQLSKVGDGISHMSPQFQYTLENSVIHDYYSEILFGSTVSIRHLETGGYLHSHDGIYPKTGNQQVTLYNFQDQNNDWVVERRNKAESDSELFDKILTVPNLLKLKLFHKTQGRYLRVNDERPPMSEQDYNNEVTLIGDANYTGDGNNEVFEIRMLSDRSRLHKDSEFRLKSIDSVFQIYHVGTGCYLLSHDVKLPDWGFDQNEVTCIDKPVLERSLWYFEKNTHPMLEKDTEAARVELPEMTFWEKLLELHRVMIRLNNGLKLKHDFASDPITWPFLTRGVNYWGEDHRNVYFLGNLVIYWSIVVVIIAFVTFLSFKSLSILRPSYFATASKSNISPDTAKYIHNVSEFALGWLLHYAPSLLMKRQLFLHHYLPSVFFGILTITQTLEFVNSRFKYGGKVIMMALVGGALWICWEYSPLIYGLEWGARKCNKSKILKSWDMNCLNYRPRFPVS